MNKQYKIGIVGGAGFIGSALAKYLSEKFKVRVLDKKLLSTDLAEKVEFQHCEIQKINEVRNGLQDLDLVIHAAIVQIPLINENPRLGYEVNVMGTQNICEVVDQSPTIQGMILTGSWHVFGESGLKGTIDERFGFRPDKVEERARLYALSKIAQEMIVRFYDEISEKIYGVIRLGTVLGEGMPEKTAANIFITRGLKGEPLTPYKHSMHRPMFYAHASDVCKAFEAYLGKILSSEAKEKNSLVHVVNFFYPEPVTIIELANMVRDAVVKHSKSRIKPEVKIVDKGQPSLFAAEDKESIKIDISKAMRFLGLKRLTAPKESIEQLIKSRMSRLERF